MAAVIACAAAVAACGGGGKTTSTSHTAITKAQFVTRADAICKRTEQQTAPLVGQLAGAAAKILSGGSGAAKQAAAPVATLHAAAAAGLAKLRALPQPAGSHKQIERFLSPLGQIIASLKTAQADLASGKTTQALALLEQDQPLAGQVTSAAKAYGLHDCQTIFSALG